jgi:hypothetical protein
VTTTLRSVAFGREPVAEAERDGRLKVTGDRRAAMRFPRMFAVRDAAPALQLSDRGSLASCLIRGDDMGERVHGLLHQAAHAGAASPGKKPLIHTSRAPCSSGITGDAT